MDYPDELYYQIALSLVPNIGAAQSKTLLEYFPTAESIFKASKKDLLRIDSFGEVRANAIKQFDDFETVKEEMAFIQKNNIHTCFITEPAYPQKMLNCADAPPLLYYRGEPELNRRKMLAIVGTRNHSAYGKAVTEELVKALSILRDVTIVSGLAVGIDVIAHRAALDNDIPTVGVLAHGLDTVYPSIHRHIAAQMIEAGGGLLSEFKSGTVADKFNFPLRNRIVAGMTDATVVIETARKGGSMITAELANGYNKDIFAVPGRITDARSEGCNYLIETNRAIIYNSPQQLIETLGWESKKISRRPQRQLFVELTEEEQKIVDILKDVSNISIDDLTLKSGLSNSKLAATILNLELQNVVRSLPGKYYELM